MSDHSCAQRLADSAAWGSASIATVTSPFPECPRLAPWEPITSNLGLPDELDSSSVNQNSCFIEIVAICIPNEGGHADKRAERIRVDWHVPTVCPSSQLS